MPLRDISFWLPETLHLSILTYTLSYISAREEHDTGVAQNELRSGKTDCKLRCAKAKSRSLS